MLNNSLPLQKYETPNKFFEELARDALARRAESADPMTQFNKVLDLTNQVKNMMPQNQTPSIEQLKLEKDSKLAEKEQDFNM
jgi:hypothetical protein